MSCPPSSSASHGVVSASHGVVSASHGAAPSSSTDLGARVGAPLSTWPGVGALALRGSNAWLGRLDALGIVLSAACIVHCAAMPLLLMMVPLLGDHAIEEGARTVLGAVGVVGIGWGAWQHRNLRAVPPLLLALALFSWMSWQQPHGQLELLLSLVASFALMLAHALNTWLCSAGHTPHTHCRVPGDGVWVAQRRSPRLLPLAVAFSLGLHVGALGLAAQATSDASAEHPPGSAHVGTH